MTATTAESVYIHRQEEVSPGEDCPKVCFTCGTKLRPATAKELAQVEFRTGSTCVKCHRLFGEKLPKQKVRVLRSGAVRTEPSYPAVDVEFFEERSNTWYAVSPMIEGWPADSRYSYGTVYLSYYGKNKYKARSRDWSVRARRFKTLEKAKAYLIGEAARLSHQYAQRGTALSTIQVQLP